MKECQSTENVGDGEVSLRRRRRGVWDYRRGLGYQPQRWRGLPGYDEKPSIRRQRGITATIGLLGVFREKIAKVRSRRPQRSIGEVVFGTF